MLLLLFGIFLRGANAYELITAYEAYEMVKNNEATLIDVRTIEEYVFVGNPALEPDGDPVAYLIPWEFLDGVDEEGIEIYRKNPDFDDLFEQVFGSDKDQPLIIICRSGNRSSYAAQQLEERGFTSIYEVDNRLKELSSFPGGRGGFQGSGYKGLYDGYRGYPGRLTCDESRALHRVATYTDAITDGEDSVAWMDLGLPMTQRLDPRMIPKLNKASQTLKTASVTQSPASSSFTFFQPQLFPLQGAGFFTPSFSPNRMAFMSLPNSFPNLFSLSVFNFPTAQRTILPLGIQTFALPQPVAQAPPQSSSSGSTSDCGG
jgi:rhodanese-related sulfurtransferase